MLICFFSLMSEPQLITHYLKTNTVSLDYVFRPVSCSPLAGQRSAATLNGGTKPRRYGCLTFFTLEP